VAILLRIIVGVKRSSSLNDITLLSSISWEGVIPLSTTSIIRIISGK
jgi:hypothetical protein